MTENHDNETAAIIATVNRMNDAFGAGRIEDIMTTYEDGAVVVAEPGKPLSGGHVLRAMFGQFVAAGAKFDMRAHEVVRAGDLALHLSPWTMTGKGPDGERVEGTGLSVAVLRRQDDGSWRMVIDHPFGDAITHG